MTDAIVKTARVKARPIPAAKPLRAAAAATKPAAPVAAIATKDETMTDINQTAEQITAKAQTVFADVNDRAKGAMDKGQKLAGEMNDFGKGNLEAMVESAKIAARGFETLGQEAAAYAKQSFERTSATVQQMAAVKSPTELMKLQSDFVRTSFDAMVAEGSRSTEMMLKLAGEIVQPISNRLALAADKVKAAA